VSGGKASICSVLKAEHKIVSVAVVLAAVERDAPIESLVDRNNGLFNIWQVSLKPWLDSLPADPRFECPWIVDKK
jgi:hypothetical protein